jgi:hypothetical protein
MMAGVHPSLREWANQAMTAGRPLLEPVKCSGTAKTKRRRHHRQARFCPQRPALVRRTGDHAMQNIARFEVDYPGDYATLSYHPADGTSRVVSVPEGG